MRLKSLEDAYTQAGHSLVIFTETAVNVHGANVTFYTEPAIHDDYHEWGASPGSPDTLAVFDAPPPAPQRVTLSAARLSRARQVLFLVSGESKRRAVNSWRNGGDLPALAIRPPAGVDVLLESALLAPSNGVVSQPPYRPTGS